MRFRLSCVLFLLVIGASSCGLTIKIKSSDSAAPSSNTVTLSGSVSETVAKPSSKPEAGAQPRYAALGGGELKVLNAKGETLAAAPIASDGIYSVTVAKGSNYTLRAAKGNVCLKAFVDSLQSDMAVTVDPKSSAVVKALGTKLGKGDFGEPGADASSALAGENVAAYLVAIKGDTAALDAIAAAIAADIAANANYTVAAGTVGATSTAGDAAASTLSTNITATVTVTAQTGAPSAPTGVTADPGDGWVTVSWAAVPGAIGYNLYYSTIAGVAGIKDGSVAGASATIARLTNGITYYFTVTAVNDSGESAASTQVSSAPRLGTWKTVTTNDRIDQATAVVNNIIYVIGGRYEIPGYGFAGMSSKVEAYDPATNTWTTKASMPTARRYFATAVVDGIIYLIGGQYGDALSTVEAYNPVTNSWTTRASMPTARGSLAAAIVDGKIYAIGGEEYRVRINNTLTDRTLNTVETYDPATNTWTTKASMPTARLAFSSNTVNGIIYAIGGVDGKYLSTVEAYNPANNTWTTKTSMPTARTGLPSAAVNGIIFAIAGNVSSNAVEAYDPATNIWVAKPSFPANRYHASASVVNGAIYVFGGISYVGGNGYNVVTVEMYR